MPERLQKIIAACGLCSRRKAEDLLAEGRVTVNGIAAGIGDSADIDADEIAVDGILLQRPAQTRTLLLYKPRGYVSTASDEKGRKTVLDLVPRDVRLFPVGRLDLNSEGLLLLTNDGALAQRLLHPSRNIDKVYEVWVRGWREDAAALLRRPIVLDGRPIQPPGIRVLHADGVEAKLRITIHEGRNRQIRRMCEQASLTVTRLKRIAEGPLTLGMLKPGQWRELTEEEIRTLKIDK